MAAHRGGFKSKLVRVLIVSAFLIGAAASPHAEAALISGTAGSDYLYGTPGGDKIDGLGGSDSIFGRGGNDKIFGGDGVDLLWGSSGRDKLEVGPGGSQVVDDDGRGKKGEKGDVLIGSTSNDFFFTADGEKDTVKCGAGTDYVIADANDKLQDCETIYTQSLGTALMLGSKSGETLTGDIGPNQIYGRNGDDTLVGGAGNDHLLDGKGADTLDGGPNDDILWDDDGKPGDLLLGGDGNDAIIASDGAASTIDCGPGTLDYAYYDVGLDTVANCENLVPAP